MTEKPIMFSGPMVRAILDGRKTVTRRVIKPQPGDHPNDDGYASTIIDRCPYGPVGRVLWVRETWCDTDPYKPPRSQCPDGPCYRASDDGDCSAIGHPWCPSIHMPRWASRITLEVTSIGVERVQDITPQQARREACAQEHEIDILGFKHVWDSLNAKRGMGWDANPWVWVVGFKVLEIKGGAA